MTFCNPVHRCSMLSKRYQPPLFVEVEPEEEVGVPEEQEWSNIFGCPQFGHLGGGGKELWTTPMTDG